MPLFGDWGMIPGYFMTMSSRVRAAGIRSNRSLATKGKKIWRDGIRTKSFNLQKLSPVTIAARKRRGSGSTTPLLDYKDMVNSITTTFSDDEAFVGINRQAIHKDKKTGTIKTYNLAIIHEYGCPKRNIPPRPHRQKTIDEVQKIYEKEVVNPIINAIKP